MEVEEEEGAEEGKEQGEEEEDKVNNGVAPHSATSAGRRPNIRWGGGAFVLVHCLSLLRCHVYVRGTYY